MKRFLFEWYDDKLNVRSWKTYAESFEEAETKFLRRDFLLKSSLDNKYMAAEIVRIKNLNDE